MSDLVLYNANVITMSPGRPRVSLVAVRDGRVWRVGGDELLDDVRSGGRVIDCEGRTLLPGFNDAHCHIFSFIRKLLSIDLTPAAVSSIEDIKAVVGKAAQGRPPGEWITGTDYSEFNLSERRHPTRWELDEVAPEHPVVLSHRSLHACVLNSRALALAGITRETEEPPGARIERDLAQGEPNGLLYEMLGFIREKVMPPWCDQDLERGMKLVGQQFVSQGLTSLQDATVVNDLKRWRTLRRFVDSGRLKSRIWMMAGHEAVTQFAEAGLRCGDGDDRLRLGAMKIVPSNVGGEMYPSQDALNRLVMRAHDNGFPVAIHAVRESAVEAAITSLENAAQSHGKEWRDRLEHCAECPPRLLGRLARVGAMVVTQPPFVYYSGERYLATVPPEQAPWLYRFRAMLDAGLSIAASSDAPIVPHNPLAGVYAAVTRRAESGQHLLPHEAISVEEALAAYTTGAARASGEEAIKGAILPGMVADMVLLSHDPTAVEPEEIKGIRVEMTVIGGEVVWRS